MATATLSKPRNTTGTKVGTFTVPPYDEPVAVYATTKGVRFTARGLVEFPGHAFASLPRGDASKLRKALRAAGFRKHAAVPRHAVTAR